MKKKSYLVIIVVVILNIVVGCTNNVKKDAIPIDIDKNVAITSPVPQNNYQPNSESSNNMIQTSSMDYDLKTYKMKCKKNGSFVGYEDHYLYLCYSEDEHCEYVKYDIYQKEEAKILYNTGDFETLVLNEVYNGKIYICELISDKENNGYNIEIYEINEDGRYGGHKDTLSNADSG